MNSIKSTIISSLAVAVVVGSMSFILASSRTDAMFEEKFRNNDKYFELVMSRLDRIESKIDKSSTCK